MNEAPNLDCMPESELVEFWQRHQSGRNYRALFPAGGRGTKRAAADLANYASNLATARACRLRGNIQTALQYESIADRIYDRLPGFAKW